MRKKLKIFNKRILWLANKQCKQMLRQKIKNVKFRGDFNRPPFYLAQLLFLNNLVDRMLLHTLLKKI